MEFRPVMMDSSNGVRTGIISWRNDPERPSVPTPAPLLLTKRGSLPNLPTQVLPNGTTVGLCLQLPLLDFISLNPSAGFTGEALFRASENASIHGIAELANLDAAITVLSLRAAGSEDFVLTTTAATAKDSISGEVRGGGSRVKVRPEDIVKLQRGMKCDMVEAPSMATLPEAAPKAVSKAVDKSLAMLDDMIRISNDEFNLLGTVQGGTDMKERMRSLQGVRERSEHLTGIVIGGLSTTESLDQLSRILQYTTREIPPSKVRIVSGRGSPEEALMAVQHGADLVESCYPFDLAEEGLALDLQAGPAKNLFDRRMELDPRPIVPGCGCLTCSKHSRAYIHHLHNVHEMLAMTLLSIHNLHDYQQFFARMRSSIEEATFERFHQDFMKARSPLGSSST